MKRIISFKIIINLALTTVLLSVLLYGQTYSTNEAKNHINENATVKGRIVQVFVSDKGTVFLNFGAAYPNNTFSAVIFSKYAANFSNIYQYEGVVAEVSGLITTYNGKPQIILKSPAQIKIVEQAK